MAKKPRSLDGIEYKTKIIFMNKPTMCIAIWFSLSLLAGCATREEMNTKEAARNAWNQTERFAQVIAGTYHPAVERTIIIYPNLTFEVDRTGIEALSGAHSTGYVKLLPDNHFKLIQNDGYEEEYVASPDFNFIYPFYDGTVHNDMAIQKNGRKHTY